MTDQTKHDIGGLQTKNKSQAHEIRKAEDAMSDAMESLSVIDNAISCGFLFDKHSLILQEWAKEYRAEIERCKMFIENAGEANAK
tara:strand:+ start:256 stop:510 length:255 start_codon:yes stop_codon:yes gene_type:complete